MGRKEDSLNSGLPPITLPEARKPICMSEHGARAADYEENSSDEGDNDSSKPTAKRMRYMFEKAAMRTETVNKRIERIAINVKAEYKIEALANPTYPHQNTVTAVGRIMNISSDDGQTAAPISSDSLYLETSRRLGNGRRIPLDVRSAPSFSLFPGQVVAIEGKNLKGTEFSALEFRQLPLLPHAPFNERKEDTSPFSAMVACGPYTLADNFEYEPLIDLVDKAIAEAPCVVFLLGPFVSEAHPMLKGGQTDMLPEEIFRVKISPHLTRLRESLPPSASVFLVPSTDELCCSYVSFPQPPLSNALLSQLGVPVGVSSLSNPAQISINGVNFAVSNIDVLFHLVKEEVS
ncbi:DNA-directed DNA polymerase alpha subunit pol12, partial [Coemansia erecta]